MTELGQALSLGGTVEHNGKVYPVGPTTTEVIARWEDWLANETLQRVERLLSKKPDGAQQAIRIVADQSAEGVFDFYGEASRKRIGELSGLKMLTYFRVAVKMPAVTKKEIDELVDATWEQLYREQQKEQAALAALLPNDEAPVGANQSVSAGAPS